MKTLIIILIIPILIIASNLSYYEVAKSNSDTSEITFGGSFFIRSYATDESKESDFLHFLDKKGRCERVSASDYRVNIDHRFGYLGSASDFKNVLYNNYQFYMLNSLDYKIDSVSNVTEKYLVKLIQKIESNCNVKLDKVEIYGLP